MRFSMTAITMLAVVSLRISAALGREIVEESKADDTRDVRELMKHVTSKGHRGPIHVGDHYKLTISSDPEKSDVEATMPRHGNSISYTLKHDGASYMSVHFSSMDLPKGCVMKISDGNQDTTQKYFLRGRGKMNSGSFWAQHVGGDTMDIHVKCRNISQKPVFEIDQYVAGHPTPSTAEAICGPDDKQNVVCLANTHPLEYARSSAIARLTIGGSGSCTGFLISASSVLITNRHCIRSQSQATDTDFEFMAQYQQCNFAPGRNCGNSGFKISGATLLEASEEFDYAIVQLSGDPALQFGYLELNNRPAIPGEQIYIPQHPRGFCKQLAISDSFTQTGVCQVSGFVAQCGDLAYPDVGYFCDTEGGTSGSPIISSSDHTVIALHRCANCPNRGVPITEFYARVAPYLGVGFTLPPTASPTRFTCQHNIFELDLVTDSYGQETTWDVTHANDPSVNIASGGGYGSGTNYNERKCFVDGCYVFNIRDTFGDGICCAFGAGSYTVRYKGNTVATGGEFDSVESTTFGDC